MNVNNLVMCQVYVDGKGIVCQLSLNAAIVAVNMHVPRVRAVQHVSYAEAVRRVE
jgi:hypothetical protein